MKTFSFKSPIIINGDEIKINDLARNHNYKKENQNLVVEGKSEDGKIGYRAFYNLEGDFLFVKLYKHNRQRALLPWKVEYDIETVEKIDKYDNRIIVTSKYLSTSMFEHKLVEKTFYTDVNSETYKKVFRFIDGKWTSEGMFPKDHFRYWISK